MIKKNEWTKWDEFKFHLKRNIGVIGLAVILGGFLIILFDEPEHDSFMEATLGNETYSQSITGTKRVVTAILDNGSQVRLIGFKAPVLKSGVKIKIEKKTGFIFTRNSYYFVEYIE